MRVFLSLTCLSLLLSGCGREDGTQSNVAAPGAAASVKTKALEAGAAALQDKPPIDAINAYLDGFHFYNGRQQAQMEAHHYCSIVNEDVTQCVIYDGNARDAKIMGVEYIVSAKLFATQRADIAAPPVDPGADAWQQGKVFQLADPAGSPHAHK